MMMITKNHHDDDDDDEDSDDDDDDNSPRRRLRARGAGGEPGEKPSRTFVSVLKRTARRACNNSYMRNLLGWLETRLAQMTLHHLTIA